MEKKLLYRDFFVADTFPIGVEVNAFFSLIESTLFIETLCSIPVLFSVSPVLFSFSPLLIGDGLVSFRSDEDDNLQLGSEIDCEEFFMSCSGITSILSIFKFKMLVSF